MFTGFATENTPAIQVWDLQNSYASSAANRRISLTDDCAPIQYFKTGGTSLGFIAVYLPTCSIEGKEIKIINARYGSSVQYLYLYASDSTWSFGSGTEVVLYVIGPGQTLDLCYSKNFISFGPTAGQYASGWISLNQASPAAANYYATCLANSSAASANYSAVVGGQSNVTSGTYSFIGSGQSNTASGQYSAVIGGSNNTASNSNAVVIGGNGGTANINGAAVLGGTNCAATGIYGAAIAGNQTVANGSNSCVAGGSQGTSRSITGNFVFPASDVPIQNNSGRQQLATLLLGRATTDATATRLTSNTSAASTTNQVILPNNSAYTFQGTCIAAKTAAGDTSSWKFEGAIKRGANAASTALVAAVTPTVIAQDAGASTWVLAITADTTNGGIAVTVTGQAATTIRWVVKIETTEVTF